jgi:hypothetical protein
MPMPPMPTLVPRPTRIPGEQLMPMSARGCAWFAAHVFVLAVLVVVPTALAAQATPPAEPPNPLATVKSLRCRFPAATSATWKEGAPVAQTRTQVLELSVDAIDVQDGTAEVRGTAGRSFVSAVLSGWSLYFVEQAVGQLNVTTVFAQEAGPKKLKAVHSRHGYLQMQVGRYIAEPSVSQNYGECEIVE